MAMVKLGSLLAKNAGTRSYESTAGTAGEVLEELRARYGDSIEKYLAGCLVMVDGKNIEDRKGLNTRVRANSEVSVIPRVAGG